MHAKTDWEHEIHHRGQLCAKRKYLENISWTGKNGTGSNLHQNSTFPDAPWKRRGIGMEIDEFTLFFIPCLFFTVGTAAVSDTFLPLSLIDEALSSEGRDCSKKCARKGGERDRLEQEKTFPKRTNSLFFASFSLPFWLIHAVERRPWTNERDEDDWCNEKIVSRWNDLWGSTEKKRCKSLRINSYCGKCQQMIIIARTHTV